MAVSFGAVANSQLVVVLLRIRQKEKTDPTPRFARNAGASTCYAAQLSSFRLSALASPKFGIMRGDNLANENETEAEFMLEDEGEEEKMM